MRVTGTRDVKNWAVYLLSCQFLFTLTVITALSMAGVPPFNGFLSKEKFLEAMIEATHTPLFSLNTLGIVFQF